MTDISGSFGSYQGELESARIQRIVDQVLSGERDFDSIRRGLYGARFRPTTPGAQANDAAIIGSRDRAAVEARVRAIFANSGQPIATVAPAANRDAFASLQQTLEAFGLGDLSDWAWQQIVQGRTQNEVLLGLYEQPSFQQRFQMIFARREAGLSAMNPAQVIEYETRVRQLATAARLPEGMFDRPADFVPLAVADLSLPEVQARIQEGFQRVAQVAPQVREWMAEQFGVSGDAALAALYLDPNRSLPALERMTRQAEIGGGLSRFGVRLGQDRAGQLADIGVTAAATQAGGQQLEAISPLFRETISEQGDFTAEREGVDAVFGLGEGGARRTERRRLTRASRFAGGGGAQITQTGLIGLGAAD